MKYWEITADNLKKAGWSLGGVSVLDSELSLVVDHRTIVMANHIALDSHQPVHF
jgi:hypothetical protein